MPCADLVLEGGGVKGLALPGAVLRLMRAGYTFARVAGTSAGSILAALLAAGMEEGELAGAMKRLSYSRVPDRPRPGIPVVSAGISLLGRSGAYEGDYIHEFIREELKKLDVTTFKDLRRTDSGADVNLPLHKRYKLVVLATDVTGGRLLRLPWDYHKLNLDPDDQKVADAVRASISIPLFFRPVTVRDGKTGKETTLVDGGILSNYPIEIFDRTDDEEPRWPTLGVKVLPGLPAGIAELFPPVALTSLPPVRLLEKVVATAIVGHDQTYLERPCVRRRTIAIDTSGVGIVDFDVDEKRREALVAKGDEQAGKFLESWSWEGYKKDCLGATEEG